MKKNIFRKVPLSEKKVLFKEGAQSKVTFHSKGDSDELITLVLNDVLEGKILSFMYAVGSPRFQSAQNAIFNFSHGEDRYFFQARVDVFTDKVLIPMDVDVFILQRRKSPRLDLPETFPATLNIIQYDKRPCLYECKVLDFSSGGCRVQYPGDLPVFKAGETLRGVIHLSHRNPLELDCEIKHRAVGPDGYGQVFGLQFKLGTTLQENKLLVTFLDLQRELFVKWS